MFDIALIDMKLPDVDGTSLLNTLKEFDPNLVRIMVTGHPSVENAVKSINSGADGYVVKPFNPGKLLEQIKEHLQRKQKEKWENLLRKTGLSSYETKIYLSLTMEGPSEAGKLSLLSGVPRTKTYSALKKLVQTGLILEVPGENQRFSISAPTSAFNNFVQSWKKDLTEQTTTLVELENVISMLDSVHAEKQESKYVSMKKEEVWSIHESEETNRLTSEVLSKARTSVKIITTETGLIQFNRNFGKILDDLNEKGIEIQIRTPIESTNTPFMNDLKQVYKIENTQTPVSVTIIVVDEIKLLLSNLGTDDPKRGSEKEVGLFAQGETIAGYLTAILGFNKK
jgi:sugar-specific transcriptional regulator TrmB